MYKQPILNLILAALSQSGFLDSERNKRPDQEIFLTHEGIHAEISHM